MCFRILSLVIILTMPFLKVSAQISTYSVSGTVNDETGQPAIGVNVLLHSLPDSSLNKVSITDANGKFNIEQIKPGTYFIKSTMLGYDPSFSGQIQVINENLNVPVMSIRSGSKNLQEVNIAATRPLVEMKADKLVFNVENTINASGSTAFELLQKAPGVMIDQNDNVFMKGRGGVMIQIDGRPTQLTTEQLADLLKGMQASDIESIELISNPSSKYEAEGTAGIINIKLKKNKTFGTNGSITAGYAYGVRSKYNTSLSVNHRNNKLNVFGNYGNNWGGRHNTIDIYRVQGGSIFDQESYTDRSGLNNNFKAGVDFFAAKKHTIGMLVTGNIHDFEAEGHSRTLITSQDADTNAQVLTANNINKVEMNNLNFNMNYRYADTTGREFNIDADYGMNRNTRNNYQPNIYTDANENVIIDQRIYRTITPTDIDIATLKADYAQVLFKGKLGAGFKYSSVKTDNTLEFYNIIGADEIKDADQSNNFVYDENINAAYINYSYTLKNWEFQAGVRAEQTISEGNLTSTSNQADKNVKRDYLDWFPSGGLRYNLNKKNSFGLTYSSRVERPNYQELNPFEWKIDELTFRKGNPFLNPQYTDKIEFSHTYNFSITTSVSYSHTKDYFAQIADTVETTKSYIMIRNLASEDVLSFDFNASLQIKKWWGLYANAGLYNVRYEADFDGKKVSSSNYGFNIYAQNTFKLPKGFTFELSGMYHSPGIWGGAFKTTEQSSVDVGLQKKFWKEMASLRVAYSDIFFQMPWSSINTLNPELTDHANGSWESRQLRITFNYRFGNTQVKGARQRSTGNESERNRTGGGE